jgi:hypothetical protein
VRTDPSGSAASSDKHASNPTPSKNVIKLQFDEVNKLASAFFSSRFAVFGRFWHIFFRSKWFSAEFSSKLIGENGFSKLFPRKIPIFPTFLGGKFPRNFPPENVPKIGPEVEN